MIRKLIFSFTSSPNLALDHSAFVQPLIIHFGLGFDSFRVVAHTDALLVVPVVEIPIDPKPILQFDIIYEIEFFFYEKKGYHHTGSSFSSL